MGGDAGCHTRGGAQGVQSPDPSLGLLSHESNALSPWQRGSKACHFRLFKWIAFITGRKVEEKILYTGGGAKTHLRPNVLCLC